MGISQIALGIHLSIMILLNRGKKMQKNTHNSTYLQNKIKEDISEINLANVITLDSPLNYDYCRSMKRNTNARICIGRSGDRYLTSTYLRLRVDHAIAQDAVWSTTDEVMVKKLGFIVLQSQIKTREEYLLYPNLGRQLSIESKQNLQQFSSKSFDVQIIATDGLNGAALNVNLYDIYPTIVDELNSLNISIATPIFVRFGRVAIMDKISDILHPKVTCLLVGERPGLSTRDSISAYIAYESSENKPESQRTVISNISPHGTPPVEAGAEIVSLIQTMLKEKKSGVELHSIFDRA